MTGSITGKIQCGKATRVSFIPVAGILRLIFCLPDFMKSCLYFQYWTMCFKCHDRVSPSYADKCPGEN